MERLRRSEELPAGGRAAAKQEARQAVSDDRVHLRARLRPYPDTNTPSHRPLPNPIGIASLPQPCDRSDQQCPRKLRRARAKAKIYRPFPLAPQIHFGARPFASAQGRRASFAASAFPAPHKKSSGTASKTPCDDPKKQPLDLGEKEYFLYECR